MVVLAEVRPLRAAAVPVVLFTAGSTLLTGTWMSPLVLVEMVARRRQMVGILLLAWVPRMASPLSAVDLVRVTARRWAAPAAAVKVTPMAVSLVEASFIKATMVATQVSPQTRILLPVVEVEQAPQGKER